MRRGIINITGSSSWMSLFRSMNCSGVMSRCRCSASHLWSRAAFSAEGAAGRGLKELIYARFSSFSQSWNSFKWPSR